MGSIQIKKMKISDLPEVYELHQKTFPNPARPRYYEPLVTNKDAPCYVAKDDDDEVVGFIATRMVGFIRRDNLTANYNPPHLIVVALAVVDAEDNKYEVNKIKEKLLNALLVQVRIGGYGYIQADMRTSQEESINVFTEHGFEKKSAGKYQDGEDKVRMKYVFDLEVKSTTFRIEKATYQHLSRVRMLHNEYITAQKDYGYFARILKRKGSVLLVALDEYGRVVGYLAARRQHKITDDETTPYTYLNFVSMAVDKGARGRGLGAILVESMISEAKESDVEVIFGHVRETNTKARELYRKLGFKEKKIGNYKDTEEEKYMIKRRIRLPSVRPYVKPTLKNGAFVAVGYILRGLQNNDD